MNLLKLTVILSVGMYIVGCATLEDAKDSHTSNLLKYPNTVISIKGTQPSVTFKPVEAFAAKESSYPKPVSIGSRTVDGKGISCRFAGTSEYGDVYVIAILKNEKEKEIVPFIFQGKDTVAYDHGGINVSFAQN